MDGKITFEEHFMMDGSFGGLERFSVPGMAEDLGRRLLDLHGTRLSEMDQFGIEYAILSFNAPGIQAIPHTQQAIERARQANDYLAGEIAKRPDRFGGFAALPLQDPEAAVEELRRCVKDLGFVGALVNGFTQIGDEENVTYYDLPEYRVFWAAVEELDVPFYLHPRNPLPSRSQIFDGHPWFLNSAWAFAMETAMHALRLMGSGLFDEFPRLKLVLGHLGERIPYDMWRVDHRIKKSPRGIPAKKTISEYMRENVYLTTSGNFNDPTFHCAIEEVGLERVMFSVDYPFETTEDAATWFDNTEMEEADRLRVGRTGAIELFKLDLN